MGKKPIVLDANGQTTEEGKNWSKDFRGQWIGGLAGLVCRGSVQEHVPSSY